MPTTTTKFCTVAEVHTALNQHSGYNADDTLIQTQIELATQLIRNFTRREWEAGSYTDYFSTQDVDVLIGKGRGHVKFFLSERNVSGTPDVVFNTAGKFGDTQALEMGTDFYLDTRVNAIVMYPGIMTYSGRSLRVIYTAGYPINDSDALLLEVPTDIRMACQQQAAFMTRRVLNATTGTSEKSNKTGSSISKVGGSGLVMEAQALLRTNTRTLIGSNA